jgi:hypothetical protein
MVERRNKKNSNVPPAIPPQTPRHLERRIGNGGDEHHAIIVSQSVAVFENGLIAGARRRSASAVNAARIIFCRLVIVMLFSSIWAGARPA